MYAQRTDTRLLGGQADLQAHLHQHGQLPARPDLVEMVTRAGLRGRGGAGFPTGTKLRAVAEARGRPVVVVNACEGEPISAKDHALLTASPHLVLDGAVLAAQAVEANEIIVCLHEGDQLGHTLTTAIRARRNPVPTSLRAVPRRYVASEESALVNLINTGDARPTTKPPRPDQRGVRGQPTLVSNAETFAQLALIARHGPEWFREAGTMLLTVTGAVAAPGVHEVPYGTHLPEVLARTRAARDARAVLLGGVAGTWLPTDATVHLTHESAPVGVGAVFVLPARACGLAETARITQYLATESARQCGPCMFGLPAIAHDLTRLAHGTATDAPRLRRRLALLSGRGACRHPDGAARVASSALTVFAADVTGHLAGRPCQHAGRTHIPLP
jgi:NADH:ubiquinone oxidoreductase subunit F (NADH-binding)